MIAAISKATRAPADTLPKKGNVMTTPSLIERRAGLIKGVSIAWISISLFVLIRALPVDRAIDLLKSKVDGLGVLGPLALGVAYIVAALAFFPGSAFTLTAGAVFGLAWGTVTVLFASPSAAALASLLSRYLARCTVA